MEVGGSKIKYLLLVPDGAADYPLDELDGKTPLQAASTPQMDFLASKGSIGQVKTIPSGMNPGSDVAILSLLGYDPRKYYSGRGPLEAASMGIKLTQDQTAFRCNLVTVDKGTLTDYSAGHISSEEAVSLIEVIQKKLGGSEYTFYPGVSYRHLMVADGDFSSTVCMPPHDVIGKSVEQILPRGIGSEVLRRLMEASTEILKEHGINRSRSSEGKNPANMIWLWGLGKAPKMPTMKEKYGLEGAVISAVDLVKGIGSYAGLQPIVVPEATGYFDTNYLGKARFALQAIGQKDFVFVHIEAPDEAGHIGSVKEKIRAIENFDLKVVKPILEGLKNVGDFKILIAPDHATPIKIRTHTMDPVPFLIYCSLKPVSGSAVGFHERAATNTSLDFDQGYELMDYFIERNDRGDSK